MGKVVKLPQGFCMSAHRGALDKLSETINSEVNAAMQAGAPLGMISAILQMHSVGFTNFMLDVEDE